MTGRGPPCWVTSLRGEDRLSGGPTDGRRSYGLSVGATNGRRSYEPLRRSPKASSAHGSHCAEAGRDSNARASTAHAERITLVLRMYENAGTCHSHYCAAYPRTTL